MRTPHTYRHKGEKHTIDLEQVYCAKALDNQCLLIPWLGVALIYPYPLCDFEKVVAGMGFSRTHHSYLALYSAIIDYIRPDAIFSNGEKVPVSRKYLKDVEAHLAKIRMEAFTLGLAHPFFLPLSAR